MDRRLFSLQIQILVKKPYQRWINQDWVNFNLIRTNELFLSLFCLRHGFYSARHCNRGSIEHEHNNCRASL